MKRNSLRLKNRFQLKNEILSGGMENPKNKYIGEVITFDACIVTFFVVKMFSVKFLQPQIIV